MELIRAESLPVVSVDVDALMESAAVMRETGSSIAERGLRMRERWKGLADAFETPDTPKLLSGMADVEAATSDFGTATGRIGDILGQLAESLGGAERRLRTLRDEVDDLHRAVAAYRLSVGGESTSPAGADAAGDGGSGIAWGPGQYAWNAGLISERDRLRLLIDQAMDEATRDLRAIEDPVGVRLAGFAPTASPLAPSWRAKQRDFENTLALTLLERLLTAGDAEAIADLLARHPDWVRHLEEHPPAPAAVARWWSDPDAPPREALITGAALVVGALGGVPAMTRARANRALASERIVKLRRRMQLLDGGGRPVNPQLSDAESIARHAEQRDLQREIAYLDLVVNGDVNLYLYRPERGEIIEILGDPDAAVAIVSFMPGTNTTMGSFYDPAQRNGGKQGITALTKWQADNAPVAGFVVKQGAFPQLDPATLSTGPQNNDMAERLGASYARFATELHAVAPRIPVVSVEHSFGSAVGGVAETRGAKFHSRIMLAGIGMTADWKPDPETKHYAMQAPNDINRHLDEVQVGNWGYQISPTVENGVVDWTAACRALRLGRHWWPPSLPRGRSLSM
ncbi:alpha/beta hydrolase [Microbacterium sp. NPDC057407]|uniref:alpha/beta hydrolase n=1 Tax=Microbacterium sp. NPDC057407 TaxID=3346120 RepID=UPI00366C4870